MTAAEYRIEFQTQRQGPNDDNFTEIGHGPSGAWCDLDGCVYSLESGVTNGEWEPELTQPNPTDVMDEIVAARCAQ